MTTDSTMLPSTEEAFKQHVLRAKLHTLIWCKSHIPNQELIEPVGRSWSACDDGPTMHILPSAPVEVRDLTHLYCTYKECVDVGKCSCLLAGLLCVDACSCTNCVNQNIRHIDHEMEDIARCNRSTVEPLTSDHPHQRPSLSYDHISCDGQGILCVYESLTSDHPSYTTTPM